MHQILQCLLQKKLFTKAKKCEFHVPSVTFLSYIIEDGRVRADSDKIRAVAEWPTPIPASSYIGSWGLLSAGSSGTIVRWSPLTQFTSPARPFSSTPETDNAFTELKRHFTSVPILIQPDPSQQSIVEVNVSDMGIRAVFSQHSGSDKKLHPCAAFSCQLTLTIFNYDTGNSELLAIKVALEQGQH